MTMEMLKPNVTLIRRVEHLVSRIEPGNTVEDYRIACLVVTQP